MGNQITAATPSPHLPLSFSGGLMRVLGSVVLPLSSIVGQNKGAGLHNCVLISLSQVVMIIGFSQQVGLEDTTY
jgi:hypothetical protein